MTVKLVDRRFDSQTFNSMLPCTQLYDKVYICRWNIKKSYPGQVSSVPHLLGLYRMQLLSAKSYVQLTGIKLLPLVFILKKNSNI